MNGFSGGISAKRIRGDFIEDRVVLRQIGIFGSNSRSSLLSCLEKRFKGQFPKIENFLLK